MKQDRSWWRTIAGCCLALLVIAAPAFAGVFKPAAKNGVKNTYIVLLAKDAAGSPGKAKPNLPKVAEVAQVLGRTHRGRVTEVWEHALQGFVMEMPEARARHLARDRRVLSVEQDFVVSRDLVVSTNVARCKPPTPNNPWWTDVRPLPSNTDSPQVLTCPDPDPSPDQEPGPPICQDNWGLDRIDHQAGPALDERFSFAKNGTLVHVYVMDTGIRSTHREFQDANGVTRVSGGADLLSGSPVPGNSTNTDDCEGHGTHVAGIIAGRTFGVAKNAILHPVRVTSCDTDTDDAVHASRFVSGLNWIAAQTPRPAVVNWSGGNKPYFVQSAAIQSAVAGLLNANIVLVQAAGNNSSPGPPNDACLYTFGEIDPRVIVVGGTTFEDGRVTTSNGGSCVDIWAPADYVISSFRYSDNTACSVSGTSMAAPHVTGVVAAYLESNPNATIAEVDQALRSRGQWGVLQTGPLHDNYIGAHSDNVLLYSDIRAVIPSDTAPVAAFSSSCPGRQCTFNASASTDDLGITSYTWSFGDGSVITGSSPTVQHVYNSISNRTVVLKVTDATGKTDHLAKPISVTNNNMPPTASFTASCSNLTCTFDSSASTDDQGIVSRTWTFGDGASATVTGATVSHPYAGPGAFTVALTVSDLANQTGGTQQTVTLCPSPVFSSVTQSTTITSQTSIALEATASGSGLSFQWYEGAVGTTSTPVGSGASVTVSPAWSTRYWVRATNSCGSTDSGPVNIGVTAATSFYTMTPCRIIDTRGGAALANGETRDFPVTGLCGIPSGTRAVAANVTAINPPATGFLAFRAAGTNWAGTSTMSYRPAKTRANNAILPLSSSGWITGYNNGGTLDFLIDITGYFK